MMRVNLLPREPETVRIAGGRIDRGDLRRLALLALLFTMALLAVSSAQIWREQRLRALAAQTERQLEIDAPLRNRVALLAREVALLQRIDRESALARHTGNDAADAVARLGNAIPSGAWLNAIDRRPDGYFVSGGAHDLTTIAQTLDRLDRAGPLSRARLAGIGAADGSLTFNIRVISQGGLAR
jgi:Tfp pilus assembly protein PilN